MCVGIGLIISTILRESFQWEYFLPNALFGILIGYPLFVGNGWVSVSISNYFPWTQKPMKTMILSWIGTVTYSFVWLVFINWALMSYWNSRLYTVSQVFQYAYFPLIIEMLVVIIISQIYFLRHFFQSWRKLLVGKEAMKQQALLQQFETLKSQVNPHFLFNSLNVLTSLVETDHTKAVTFIRRLSDVYRYVLDSRDKDIVDIATEMKFVESWLYLARMRFGDALQTSINIRGVDFGVLPLAIQMLVENAIKHNVISATRPLHIHIYDDEDALIISNNLQIKSGPSDGSNLGLANITERFRIVCGKEPEVLNLNNEFTVRLPKIPLNLKTDAKTHSNNEYFSS